MMWFCHKCECSAVSDVLWHTKVDEAVYVSFLTICGCGAKTKQTMPTEDWNSMCSRWGKYAHVIV